MRIDALNTQTLDVELNFSLWSFKLNAEFKKQNLWCSNVDLLAEAA